MTNRFCLVLCAVVALGASQALAQPLKLAAPGFQHANFSREKADFASDHVAQLLNQNGVRVITPGEISALIGLERQKQLMGCTDAASSCMAELANAMGADGTLVGSIGTFGSVTQLNIKIIDSSNVQVLASYSGRASSDEALLDELTRAAESLAAQLKKALPARFEVQKPVAAEVKDAPVEVKSETHSEPIAAVSVAPEVKPALSTGRTAGWVFLGGGALCLIGGTVAMVSAADSASRIRQLDTSGSAETAQQALQLRNDGTTVEVVGYSLLGVGLGAALTGTYFLLRNETPPSTTVGLTVTPAGAALSFTGALP